MGRGPSTRSAAVLSTQLADLFAATQQILNRAADKLSESKRTELKASPNEKTLQHRSPAGFSGVFLLRRRSARNPVNDYQLIQPIVFSQSQSQQELEDRIRFRHRVTDHTYARSGLNCFNRFLPHWSHDLAVLALIPRWRNEKQSKPRFLALRAPHRSEHVRIRRDFLTQDLNPIALANGPVG